MLRPGTTAPTGLRSDTFTIEPLTVANAELDYECYMASPDVIRIHSDGRWPVEGFTLAQDLELIRQHEIDHQAGTSFAFVLLDPAGDNALGCVYLNPSPRGMPIASARTTFWIRQDLQRTDLPRDVAGEVNRWLLDDWPLDTHVFRVLPDEESSVTALDGIGCRRIDLDLPDEPRPYLWFAPPGIRL
jgi:RimJ/RimL family protein N-acetyltransferase